MKKFFCLLICCFMVVSSTHTIQAANKTYTSNSKNTTTVIEFKDGKQVTLKVESIKNIPYVQLESAYNSIGVSIAYRSGSIVNIYTDSLVLRLKANSTDSLIKGNSYTLKHPVVKNEDTMKWYVPLSFVEYTLPMLYDSKDVINEEDYEITNAKDNIINDKDIITEIDKNNISINSIKVLENGLPSTAYEYEIKILHSSSLPYWEWSDIDEKYVDKLSEQYSRTNKDYILSEIYTLDAYKKLWEKQYVTVNGFNFYPSTVVGVIDTIGRAIKARSLVLTSNDMYEYPPIGSSDIFNESEHIAKYEMTEDNFETFIKNDTKMVKILSNIPFDTSIYKGFRVLNAPFNINSLTMNCNVLGITHTGDTQIVLVASLEQIENTFYHELGHTWANLCLKNENDLLEYAKIRGHNENNKTGEWENLTIENLAEDFNYVMSPYAKSSNYKTSYGVPTKTESNKILSFIKNKQAQKAINKTNFINGEQSFGDLYFTKKDTLTFKGMAEENFVINVIGKNNSKISQTISIDKDNNYNKSIKLSTEGIYKISGFYGGEITVYYYPNVSTEKVELNSTINNQNNWFEVDTTEVSEKVSDWNDIVTIYGGYWLLERSNKNYLSISDKNNYIDIESVQLLDNQTIVTVKSGTKKSTLLELPLTVKNKPIVVNGLNNDYISEYDNRNFVSYMTHEDYYKQDNTIGLFLKGQIRTSTGTVYYEIICGNEVIYKNLIQLDTSNKLHWSIISNMIEIDNVDTSKEAKVMIYEDSKKTKLIDTLYY